MKTNNKIYSVIQISPHREINPRIFNLRPCPLCGEDFFGMPGGRDSVCKNCGYKDPCCND